MPLSCCFTDALIILDMIISVKETTVFSVFHPDAHDLFNTCSDLKKVAWELWDPQRRLNDEVQYPPHKCSLSTKFTCRKKLSTYSEPLHPCSASVRPEESKSQSRKWEAASSSSRRSLMASACSCTSAAMNTSIVRGLCRSLKLTV